MPVTQTRSGFQVVFGGARLYTGSSRDMIEHGRNADGSEPTLARSSYLQCSALLRTDTHTDRGEVQRQ